MGILRKYGKSMESIRMEYLYYCHVEMDNMEDFDKNRWKYGVFL